MWTKSSGKSSGRCFSSVLLWIKVEKLTGVLLSEWKSKFPWERSNQEQCKTWVSTRMLKHIWLDKYFKIPIWQNMWDGDYWRLVWMLVLLLLIPRNIQHWKTSNTMVHGHKPLVNNWPSLWSILASALWPDFLAGGPLRPFGTQAT